MSFFQNVRTAEDLKRQFRHLVKTFHPDMGGNAEDMKEINREYEQLLRRVGNVHLNKEGEIWEDTKGPKDRFTCDISELDDGFREIVIEVMKMTGIEILLVGSWIWLEGETRPWKDALKKLGFKWSAPRQKWYWHQADYRRRHASKASFDEICAFYGVRSVNGHSEKEELKKIA